MSLSRSFIVVPCLFAVAVLAGCLEEDSADDTVESASSDLVTVPCPDVSGTDISRSLAVTDPAVLAKFGFARVMNQIRTTANVATTDTTLGAWRRWMRTFGSTAAAGDCNDPNIDPNDFGLVCPRASELALAGVNPFAAASPVKFVPVAVFNRFDLAPTNGAHCGEYRVVYAMTGSSATVFGRAFIIFEAALPNPKPADGIEACLPVARFWQGLTTDASVASRATKLDKFYFTGGAVPGFAPVVRAAHYGLSTNTAAPGAGQIRTNFFLGGEWHLREFKTNRHCTAAADPATCLLDMAHVTVKSNPANELFKGTHALSASFRTAFVKQVPALASADVNKIRMGIANGFNEFESSAQSSDVSYRVQANATMKADLTTKLAAMGSTLTAVNILDRATTQTCGGCHQLSNGANLGGGKRWPDSLGFVHVDEGSNLSPALTTTFLPNRKRVLEKFINDRCVQAGAAAAEAGEADATVGGSAEGAPN